MSKTQVTIYHNPRCSKSRQTLALIEERGILPKVVYYLDNPPSTEKLQQLLVLLGLSARQLMRKGESLYKTQKFDAATLSETELVNAMCKYPTLIERPIVECNNRACIGKPPERVLDLL